MSARPPEFTWKAILPPHQWVWIWTRLKVYLAVSMFVTAGFFVVAAWIADPAVASGVTFGLLATAGAVWLALRTLSGALRH